MDKDDRHILDYLESLKWRSEYKCSVCRHNHYKKGKKPLSRRCSKCDYDESLLKYTALEGLRIPVITAYRILEDIYENCWMDTSSKEIELRRTQPENPIDHLSKPEIHVDDASLVSVDDLLTMWDEGKFEHDQVNAILVRHYDSKDIFPADLSRRFNVEENTIKKLIEKVDTRLRCISEFESLQNIARGRSESFGYVISLVMYPLVGKWQDGKTEVDGNEFSLNYSDSYGHWTLFKKTRSGVYEEYDDLDLKRSFDLFKMI